jgi:hypothetical protein
MQPTFAVFYQKPSENASFYKTSLNQKQTREDTAATATFIYSTSCINQTPPKLTFNNRKIIYQPKPTPRKTPQQPYKTKSKKPSKITYRQ